MKQGNKLAKEAYEQVVVNNTKKKADIKKNNALTRGIKMVVLQKFTKKAR